MTFHSFNTDVAKEVGINAAVIFQNISLGVEYSRANNEHLYDGYYWIVRNIDDFEELFPYMSKSQISAALKKLEDAEYIKTGIYNPNPFDRTKWYTMAKNGWRCKEDIVYGNL